MNSKNTCKTIGNKLVLVKNSIENVERNWQQNWEKFFFKQSRTVNFDTEGQQVHGRPEDNTRVKEFNTT